jgi:hypothetical protein
MFYCISHPHLEVAFDSIVVILLVGIVFHSNVIHELIKGECLLFNAK